MKNYLGIAVSIGVLAAVWTQVSVALELVTWVGFAAWACYFAAGGGRAGFQKGLAANLSGLVYGWLVAAFIGAVSFPGALAVSVGVVAALMCLQAGWAPLSFIRGRSSGRQRTSGRPSRSGPPRSRWWSGHSWVGGPACSVRGCRG